MIGRSALRALGLLNSLFAMAVFSAPRPANAQQAVERSARATVDSFFAFAARERWDSAATMLDLVRFEAFFKGVVRNVRSAIPPRPVTVEDLMAQDSTMPRVVAEWQIARMKSDGSNPFFYLSYEFSGVANQHDLFALTISTAAARSRRKTEGRRCARHGESRDVLSPIFQISRHPSERWWRSLSQVIRSRTSCTLMIGLAKRIRRTSSLASV